MARYLALGDSYTIGTGATDESKNFPSLLAARVQAMTGVRVIVQNPAQNGYTTSDLIQRELPQVGERPDLVSVLIGANDIVQGLSQSRYRGALHIVYDFVARFQLQAGCVLAVSVPDFSRSPAAAEFGAPADLRRRIDAFNSIAREEAVHRGFTWVDLGEVSRSGLAEPGWLADDGLHPSDRQYAAWAEFIWPIVERPWTAAGRVA